MVSLPMTWVKEGGMVRLDKKYLQTSYKGVSTDDVLYTILASDGQPKHGKNSVQDLVSWIIYCVNVFFLFVSFFFFMVFIFLYFFTVFLLLTSSLYHNVTCNTTNVHRIP